MKKLKMRKNATPGILITVCGLDGCGKTTMLNKMLSDFEKEGEVFITKQPIAAIPQSRIWWMLTVWC